MILLIDLNLAGKEVLIVGGGQVGERKAKNFLDEKSEVTIASKNFSQTIKQLSKDGKISLEEIDLSLTPELLDPLISKAEVVIATTTDSKLNKKIANKARKNRAIVCVVDDPSNSDFSNIAIAKVGDVKIAVYTAGKSPAMARVLRQKIEKILTPKDILQVKLQEYIRTFAKDRIASKSERKKVLYYLIRNREVNGLLINGELDEAKSVAKKIIESRL